MKPKVDVFLSKQKTWALEMEKLRTIILDCGLNEDFKWYKPCYTLNENNVVLIHGFKNYCALLFFKGALLKDPKGILVQQTENVQAARQIRFNSIQQIKAMQGDVKAYIQQAIAIEKAGLKVELKKNSELTFPEEFVAKFADVPELKSAFDALTPGRQKAYQLFFTAPKQTKTRQARIEKAIPNILKGKGLND